MKRLLALLLSLALLSGCAPQSQPVDNAASSPPPAQSQPESAIPEPTVAHLMVAGDIMSHMPITNDAYVAQEDRYDYGHMLQFAAQQLSTADYAVGNLETTLAGGPNYSGYPAFNSPDALAYDAKAAGLDLVSTANNHCRDKGLDGLKRTLDVLDEAGLAHVGTYRSQAERDANSGIYVADVGGISVAFLSYTYGLNGFQLSSDTMYAVNLFNLDYYTTLSQPNKAQMEADLAAARALNTDLIAVMIHWGVEYQNTQNSYQESLAEFLVGQGADLVLGGHPHVLQPYETVTVSGWDGAEHQGFVCYSLGNFLSNQQELETKTTVILDLELTKDPQGGTTVTGVSYTPYYMVHRDSAPVGEQRYLVNIHDAMTQYESGSSDIISASAYQELQNALVHCHQILGSTDDLGLRP